MKRLLDPFSEKPELEVADNVKEAICDILAFCVAHHGYQIKYFLLGNNITAKVLNLLKSKHKHLVLAAIRFFRAFIGMKDDFYNKHLTKRNLFDPLIEVFKENVSKYNLINSAIIELFEFIRKENVKLLIQHIVENYAEFLKTVNYVDTFKLLLVRHDQNQEAPKETTDTGGSTPLASSSGSNGRTEGEDEEYFNTDEEDSIPQPTPNPEEPQLHKTVSSEEEREFKPLPRRTEEEEPTLLKSKKEEQSPERSTDNGKKGKINFNLGGIANAREEEGSANKRQKT